MKKIAVVMESWKRCFTYAWPSGMMTRINETGEDINLYLFNSSANWSSDGRYNAGESNIFRLPDFKEFDGIVLDLNNSEDEQACDYVIKKAKQSGVPTIVIGNVFEDFYTVAIDNYHAMYSIVEHLYEHHGSRSFWCIMGPEDNYENRRRKRAIEDCLRTHGILDRHCKFYYESFAYDCGVNGFLHLWQTEQKLPDAIVCANDNIAVGVLAEAEKLGLTAPKDFLITGFDDLDKSRYYTPRISTISYTREDIGYACIEMFLNIWQGKKQEKVRYTSTTPIFWDSCGCESDIKVMGREYLKDHILYGVEQDKFMEHILELNYELSHCNTVDEMLTCIPKSIPTLQCDAMYLVTDPHLTQQEEIHVMQGVPKNMLQDPFVETGYPEKMTIAFSYENNAMTDGRNQAQHINGIFPFFDSEEKGVNFLFVPLHFKEKCVGFFAIRNAIYLMEQQLLFEIMNSLTRALEQLYTKGQMARMNQVLSVLYNRDSMTMLYNRIALEERATELLSRYHRQGSRLCVMYIDLDRLKFINDTYGHDMGDFAIKAVAFILHQKKSEEAIAFRLGGDEFLLIQPMRDENEAAFFCDSIQKELEAYGEKENFPTPLSMSYGWVMTAPDEGKDIEYYMQQADDKMYHHKCARKMQRQD